MHILSTTTALLALSLWPAASFASEADAHTTDPVSAEPSPSASATESSEPPVPTWVAPVCPETPVLTCSPEADALEKGNCCSPSPGGMYSYTQLWSNETDRWTMGAFQVLTCDGKRLVECDAERAWTDQQIGKHMQQYDGGFTDEWRELSYTIESMGWPGQENGEVLTDIWTRIWGKSATCISTLETKCHKTPGHAFAEMLRTLTYTQRQLPTRKFLDEADIKPSDEETYARADIVAAAKKGSGLPVSVLCDDDGTLKRIKYTYRVKGPWQDHVLEAPEDHVVLEIFGCPETGIKYPTHVPPPTPEPESEATPENEAESSSEAAAPPTEAPAAEETEPARVKDEL